MYLSTSNKNGKQIPIYERLKINKEVNITKKNGNDKKLLNIRHNFQDSQIDEETKSCNNFNFISQDKSNSIEKSSNCLNFNTINEANSLNDDSLIIKVKVDNKFEDAISVNKNDDPKEIAANFIQKNSYINQSLIKNL